MSADFWAGYISGAVGIVIGNPLDILKVRLQARGTTIHTIPPPPSGALSPTSTPILSSPQSFSSSSSSLSLLRKFSTGTAAPILGYGALNALLFVSYNRSEALLNQTFPSGPTTTQPSSSNTNTSTTGTNLWITFLAGAIGGLATWVVSTPTELIKCRAQLTAHPETSSSWTIAKQIWRNEGGPRGFYFGGAVTAIRDSVGYGFYFWSYELSTQWMDRWLRDRTGGAASTVSHQGGGVTGAETAKVLLCGGIAGIATWVSIFPLDVIKTRVQAQVAANGLAATPPSTGERTHLLGNAEAARTKRLGAIEIAREAYRECGLKVFFRGLTVCSVRAFIVNAVQWATYEWIMRELGQGREKTVGL